MIRNRIKLKRKKNKVYLIKKGLQRNVVEGLTVVNENFRNIFEYIGQVLKLSTDSEALQIRYQIREENF